MTPQERKAASEATLRHRGIPLNEHLPLIESEEAVQLRSADDVLRRMISLWAVVGSAFLRNGDRFRNYMTRNAFESWMSSEELAFLQSDARSDSDIIRYTWRLECLYFLAWCAGLIEKIEIPQSESTVEPIMYLFPQALEVPDMLRTAMVIRSKCEILDWSDLLYRTHWAVRDAGVAGRPLPAGLHGGVVREWHLAVNWMTGYGDDDDWDHVATDT